MRRLIYLLFILLPASVLAQEEYETHLASIRASSSQDSAFVEYVIRQLLDGPQDLVFVSNRNLLDGLCVSHCSQQLVEIHDTLAKGKLVDIKLQTEEFDSAAHQYSYFSGPDSLIETIDGLAAYGSVDAIPRRQISGLSIKWGKRQLEIPQDAFENLYNPNLCQSEIFHQAVMAYPSIDGKYLYVYIYGGQGAGTYFAKLIFDKKRYLKKIVSEYSDLIRYNAFRWEFIGY
ncbi:MAG: hypothetical protein AAF206_04570 [Bacteroidota bacterium]